MRRLIPRIDGDPRQLVFARRDVVFLCDATTQWSDALYAFDIPNLLDFATNDQHVMLFAERLMHSYSRITGELIAFSAGHYLDPAGHAQMSPTCPEMVVWAGEPNRVIRFGADGIVVESPPPEVDGQWILPVAENRWLSWANGSLRLWRSIGDAWENKVGDAELPMTSGCVVLGAHLLVLVQKSEEAISLFVVTMSDGTLQTSYRFEDARDIRISEKKGYALVRKADDIEVVDFRLNRVSHGLYLPHGVQDFAIDPHAQRFALLKGDGVDYVEADTLTRAARHDGQYDIVADTFVPDTVAGESAFVLPDDPPPSVVWPSEFPQLPLLRLDPLAPLTMGSRAPGASHRCTSQAPLHLDPANGCASAQVVGLKMRWR